jgi:hypothetical protein
LSYTHTDSGIHVGLQEGNKAYSALEIALEKIKEAIGNENWNWNADIVRLLLKHSEVHIHAHALANTCCMNDIIIFICIYNEYIYI